MLTKSTVLAAAELFVYQTFDQWSATVFNLSLEQLPINVFDLPSVFTDMSQDASFGRQYAARLSSYSDARQWNRNGQFDGPGAWLGYFNERNGYGKALIGIKDKVLHYLRFSQVLGNVQAGR